MKRPNDVDDYSQCVQQRNGETLAFCVECDDWHRVMVSCQATAFFRFGTLWPKVSNCLKLNYLCGRCQSDVGYLLSDGQKGILIKVLDIPIDLLQPPLPIVALAAEPAEDNGAEQLKQLAIDFNKK